MTDFHSDAAVDLRPADWFEREHHRLNQRLQLHLLEIVGGHFASAQRTFDHWWEKLVLHMQTEEEQLFPRIPPDARWNARLYCLEHERIRLLATEYADLLARAAEKPPRTKQGRCVVVLALLDRAHPLRHLIQHHNEREETALAKELPDKHDGTPAPSAETKDHSD